VHADVPGGIRVEMLDAVLRYQGPVLLAEMGGQTGVGHGRDAQGRIFCPAIDIVGNWLLSDLGIHAADAIGPAGQFNLLPTLTLLLAGPKPRKAVTGRHRVNRRFFPAPPGGLSVKNGMRFADYRVMGAKKQKSSAVTLDPSQQAWRSPVQHQLDGLFGELAAFNERIAELVKQGHQSHAMRVLKAQALSLAGQIDELRCFLVVPRR
jgi:hypothetical protein